MKVQYGVEVDLYEVIGRLEHSCRVYVEEKKHKEATVLNELKKRLMFAFASSRRSVRSVNEYLTHIMYSCEYYLKMDMDAEAAITFETVVRLVGLYGASDAVIRAMFAFCRQLTRCYDSIRFEFISSRMNALESSEILLYRLASVNTDLIISKHKAMACGILKPPF